MRRGDRHFRLASLGARTRVNARVIAALIALFTFTLQTYVVQTHIHVPGFETSAFGQVNHPSPLDGKNGQDDCPICQAFAATGSFVTPALIILALVLTFVATTFFAALPATAGPRLARNWQSRAPPRH
jgi:hypothetical protein